MALISRGYGVSVKPTFARQGQRFRATLCFPHATVPRAASLVHPARIRLFERSDALTPSCPRVIVGQRNEPRTTTTATTAAATAATTAKR
jgi:hypothetical protein